MDNIIRELRDRLPEIAILVCIVGLFIVMIFAIISGREDAIERERLFEECLQDKKEYECYILFKKPSSSTSTNTIVMPTKM